MKSTLFRKLQIEKCKLQIANWTHHRRTSAPKMKPYLNLTNRSALMLHFAICNLQFLLILQPSALILSLCHPISSNFKPFARKHWRNSPRWRLLAQAVVHDRWPTNFLGHYARSLQATIDWCDAKLVDAERVRRAVDGRGHETALKTICNTLSSFCNLQFAICNFNLQFLFHSPLRPAFHNARLFPPTSPSSTTPKPSRCIVCPAETMKRLSARMRRKADLRAMAGGEGRVLATAMLHWHLPADQLASPPLLGDAIVDSDEQSWTIVEIAPPAITGRWLCRAREPGDCGRRGSISRHPSCAWRQRRARRAASHVQRSGVRRCCPRAAGPTAANCSRTTARLLQTTVRIYLVTTIPIASTTASSTRTTQPIA